MNTLTFDMCFSNSLLFSTQKSIFKGWWDLEAFVYYCTHLYKIVRHQLSYMQLYNTQHAFKHKIHRAKYEESNLKLTIVMISISQINTEPLVAFYGLSVLSMYSLESLFTVNITDRFEQCSLNRSPSATLELDFS